MHLRSNFTSTRRIQIILLLVINGLCAGSGSRLHERTDIDTDRRSRQGLEESRLKSRQWCYTMKYTFPLKPEEILQPEWRRNAFSRKSHVKLGSPHSGGVGFVHVVGLPSGCTVSVKNKNTSTFVSSKPCINCANRSNTRFLWPGRDYRRRKRTRQSESTAQLLLEPARVISLDRITVSRRSSEDAPWNRLMWWVQPTENVRTRDGSLIWHLTFENQPQTLPATRNFTPISPFNKRARTDDVYKYNSLF